MEGPPHLRSLHHPLARELFCSSKGSGSLCRPEVSGESGFSSPNHPDILTLSLRYLFLSHRGPDLGTENFPRQRVHPSLKCCTLTVTACVWSLAARDGCLSVCCQGSSCTNICFSLLDYSPESIIFSLQCIRAI